MGPDPRKISAMLADDIEGVIDALGLDGKRRRRSFVAFCPWDGQKTPKLYIDVKHRRGAWINFDGAGTGDALDLVAACLSDGQTRGARGKAMAWARAYLKIEGELDSDEIARRAAEALERQKKRAAQHARELGQQRKTAKGLWLSAQPITEGDAAWEYLKARQVDLAELPRMPRALRYSAEQRWHDEATGDVAHVGPAILAAMTLASGDFGSLHRTWINPDRPGEKADVIPARKMWPESAGCAIRLWRGESGLSERQAAERGLVEDLVLCEGVETGLSIALIAPEMRVTAVGSLPGLLSFEPPKAARRLIVAAENDWTNPQAEALLLRACSRFVAEFGRPVSVARSPEGNDFNDLLKGA